MKITTLITSANKCWRMHELRRETGLTRTQLHSQLLSALSSNHIQQHRLNTGETVYFARIQG